MAANKDLFIPTSFSYAKLQFSERFGTLYVVIFRRFGEQGHHNMKKHILLIGLMALSLTGCKEWFKKKDNDDGEKKQTEVVKKDTTSTAKKKGEKPIVEPEKKETFWLGADISWATQMEQRGEDLYNFTGDRPWECTALMKDLGLNAVRLRVWVDPMAWEREQAEKRKQLLADKPVSQKPAEEPKGRQKKQKASDDTGGEMVAFAALSPVEDEVEETVIHAGSCDKEDLLDKALRAKRQGMEVMVDFHYSDSWADPKKQPVPLSWKGHSYDEMRQDLRNHTIEVLKLLKNNGVNVKWVQIGNEVSDGLLWSRKTGREAVGPDGKPVYEDNIGNATYNPDQYAGFIQAGCEAAKSVFPDVITIVHLDNGWDSNLYEWNLGILRRYGVDYDMVGMSLYPYWAREEKGRNDADEIITDCMKNIVRVHERFGKESMIVETGFEVNESDEAVMNESKRQFMRVLKEAQNDTDGHCKGVFYWEPECRPTQYKLGAFSKTGRPTIIMEAFKEYSAL